VKLHDIYLPTSATLEHGYLKIIAFAILSFSGFEESLRMFGNFLVCQQHQNIMNDFLIHFSKFYKMIFQKGGLIKIQKSL